MSLLSSRHARAAVLGHPIAHSLSPALHRAAYRHLDLDWTYDALDVTATQLPEFVRHLTREWAGLSLTMPLKEAVLPLLTSVEPVAATLRSVNTVVVAGEDRHGYNTDVTGLVRVLEDLTLPPAATVAVLGAGATARSAVAALARLSLGTVHVCARRSAAAADLAAVGDLLGRPVTLVDWEHVADALTADLVISTLPIQASDVVVPEVPSGAKLLLDVLYDPWPTPLAAGWERAGGTVTGGLAMLVHQAVEQVRLMTGRAVPASILWSAGIAEVERRKIAQAEQ